MSNSVQVPLWLMVLLLLIAAVALYRGVLLPGVQWFFRRKVNKVIDELNTRLQVQIRPFQHTRKQVLVDRLTFDKKILEYIEQLASDQEMPRQVAQNKVRQYAREIVPAFNALVYFRIGFWIAKRLSRFLYRVKVNATEPAKLSNIDSDATVVFVMNHRSNMDYLLVSYLLAEQVILSYAVGEWAKVFPLESMVRAMGAFFVRRKSDNQLYRKVLERYVRMATKEGVCQAVFPEGGLTRDGSTREPRLGFIDYMLRDYQSAGDRDIVFVPVAINYDRVLEDENMLCWNDPTILDGADKPKKRGPVSTLWRFFKENLFIGSRNRWKKYGYAGVNFGVPVSMRDYSKSMDIQWHQLEKGARFEAVGELAATLMTSVKHVIPILPVPLVATVFVNAPEQIFKSIDIAADVDSLADRLIAAGSAMTALEKPRSKTISEALTLLVERNVLLAENDLYQVNPGSLPILQYYANSISHFLEKPD